ncbi:hypothetical protein [Agromyces salentinus]|uniref:ABC transporter permease n=1 Tax=Agromyces salentinus TaxID=269421 RepID=A0ABN2MEK6_9MICO|nr:hypothetical protein [Agromyces salentinus]
MTATDTSALERSRVTFGGVFASEFSKFASLRSSWWLSAAAVVGLLVFVAFWSAVVSDPTRENVVAAAANGFVACGLFVLLVGAGIATADHDNHAITVYFAAVPARTPLVLAKVLLAAIVGGVVGGVAMLTGLGLSIALHGGGADLGDPEVLRVLGEAALLAAILAVTATCLGLMFRSTIATLGVAIGYLYLVPIGISLVPLDAFVLFSDTFPGKASDNFFALTPDPSQLDPVAGTISSVIWTIALIVFTTVWVKRRNA